ncbi:MAG: Uma2 family endonuclease [Bryobacteraceae bacterium]
MPAVVEVHSVQLPSEARRRLTREDCGALEAAGLLERERYELIDGELIRKMGKSRLHSNTLRRFLKWLSGVFDADYVEHEVPINLSATLDATNEPEPDATVLRQPALGFNTIYPGPLDILLVAEVSASTRDYDLGAKAALYARAGIVEYWVLDLVERRIVVHRNPMGESYGSIIAYAADEAVAPLAAESASIRLQDLT